MFWSFIINPSFEIKISAADWNSSTSVTNTLGWWVVRFINVVLQRLWKLLQQISYSSSVTSSETNNCLELGLLINSNFTFCNSICFVVFRSDCLKFLLCNNEAGSILRKAFYFKNKLRILYILILSQLQLKPLQFGLVLMASTVPPEYHNMWHCKHRLGH